MQQGRKRLAQVLMGVGVVGVALWIAAGVCLVGLFRVGGPSAYVSALIQKPEALGRYIHQKAVTRLIEAQEASSFKEVSPPLILLSFFDPDEWDEALGLLVDRGALLKDAEQVVGSLGSLLFSKAPSPLVVETTPYLAHVKRQLPEIVEIFLTIAPECSDEDAAWFNENSVPPLVKGMPRCLPSEPHRSAIKAYAMEKVEERLSAVPESVSVYEALAERGISTETIQKKMRLCFALFVSSGCWFLLMLGAGAWLYSEDFKFRKAFGTGLMAVGGAVAIAALAKACSAVPYPLVTLLGLQFTPLIGSALVLCCLGFASRWSVRHA